jgi:hypothetical protein
MACKIQRDIDNNIVEVTANNGASSILFNEIASIKDPEDALLEYASTFTKEFTDTVEKHFANIEGNELYDENGEVRFEVYNKIMNPEQTLLNTSLQSKFNTSKKNIEFSSKLKEALLDFIKGLNIEVNDKVPLALPGTKLNDKIIGITEISMDWCKRNFLTGSNSSCGFTECPLQMSWTIVYLGLSLSNNLLCLFSTTGQCSPICLSPKFM